MDNTIDINNKRFKLFIDRAKIQTAVARVADAIEKEYQNSCPVLLNVLEGSNRFVADLMTYLNIEVEILSVKCSSYQGLQSTQKVEQIIGLSGKLDGRRILIVEDIVDTGLTIKTLTEQLQKHHPQDIKVATLTFKPSAYRESLPIDFVGFEIENKFVVGYGLDYEQKGRQLNDIYQLDI